jgi:hypothetical protein
MDNFKMQPIPKKIKISLIFTFIFYIVSSIVVFKIDKSPQYKGSVCGGPGLNIIVFILLGITALILAIRSIKSTLKNDNQYKYLSALNIIAFLIWAKIFFLS